MDEHRVIEQVLSCLEKLAEECEEKKQLDDAAARDVIAFLRTFADRCHHSKEEGLLFPALEGRGFSTTEGPTAVMRSEHGAGRQWVEVMEAAIEGATRGDAGDIGKFVSTARDYVGMIRLHIRKEDECLFPMAEQALDTTSLADLQRSFQRVEKEELGETLHLEFVQLADRLADRFGVEKAEVSWRGCGHEAV